MKSIILKRKDQQNHLMDLNFNQQRGRISDHMYPFYRVFDDKGQQYCDCSHEEYAIRTVELHEQHQNETFTYRRIDAPKPLPHILLMSMRSMRQSYQANEDCPVLIN